jgi:hypothetical protein
MVAAPARISPERSTHKGAQFTFMLQPYEAYLSGKGWQQGSLREEKGAHAFAAVHSLLHSDPAIRKLNAEHLSTSARDVL